jgi:echinoderm microtubule-associated protein-like 6
MVTGIFSGSLLLWKGRSISKQIAAHQSACNSIWKRTAEKGFITGGNDGLVIVWSENFEQLNTLNIKESSINSFIPKVRSVCENNAGTKILVGTRGGEIIEFTGKKSVMHLKSHCQDELWGLSCHPHQDQFYTVGQDCMLAIWDIKTRRQLKFARLDCGSDVIEFSSDGKYVAIGYRNGQVTVLDSKSFAIKAVRRDRKHEISEIKFDPHSKIMAVGAQDGMIYLYSVEKRFKPLRKCKGHHSRILHIDFSEDGEFMKSVCTSYEILFFDSNTGKQVTSGASSYRDENWETYTTRLGWHVQGIWPAFADGSDINSVDRSPDGQVVATADDFGFVKLFRFPCPVEKAAFNDYIGHSSHVTKVRFHKKISYLISTGGNDKAVFQWKYELDKEGADEPVDFGGDDSDLDDEFKTTKYEGDQSIPPPKPDIEDGGGLFSHEDVGGGDERLAVLPFKGEVDNSWPSDFKKSKLGTSIPDGNLKMDYVHGYRGFDMRDSVKYADDPNEIIYTAAALGIVLKKEENEQRFFNQHRDDVVSMDIHPLRNIVATGQMAAKGRAKLIDLYVWDSDDCSILSHITGFHRRAINVIKFSPSGKYLLSVGEDDNHSVAIYEWQSGR